MESRSRMRRRDQARCERWRRGEKQRGREKENEGLGQSSFNGSFYVLYAQYIQYLQ